jgi:glutamate/tyrosine decarboxylase-like PLP-dependent enzyme
MSNPVLTRAAEHAQTYLSTIRDRRVAAPLDGNALRRMLATPLDDRPTDAVSVIDTLAAAGREGTAASQGPRYFGFVVGGSVPAATAADWLVSAWDQNASLFVLSPVAAVVEEIVAGWIKELVGLPQAWSAGFVTGGQMANFTSLAAARHHVLHEAGWDVERDGLFGAPPIDVVVSAESHYTIFTSLRMLGLGGERVRRVDTDGQGRIQADALAHALQDGAGPCIICAQAGNVNTGAFDPLAEIAPLSRKRGAWLHVDAAFGLWAATSPALQSLVHGVELADSIATDAHKWLNVPYDSGIALTAHPASHRRALTLPAHYIQETKAERDPHEFTPEESRRARAIAIYAALRTLGRTGLREVVERCCVLARRMAATLSTHPQVRLLNDVVLNQVLVQFVPANRTADAARFTQSIITKVQDEGTCWLGATTWQGHVAARISISNWSTSEHDVDRSAAAILAAIE